MLGAGKFQKVLDAILNETRPISGVQQDTVETDLELLFKATEGKVGTDEVRKERIKVFQTALIGVFDRTKSFP